MSAPRTPAPPEAALYAPVKTLLEDQGYVVKGEVTGCDVVGVRGDEQPVIVELKRAFGLALVLQGIDRLAMTDAVYLAVGEWPRRLADVRGLCRRLGLGLVIVARGRAEVLLDPLPYQPRRSRRRTARLLAEHQRRVGDPTAGGSVRRPIMTAYRQEALRCADRLQAGPASPRAIRGGCDAPNAGRILRDDVYGWFERVERGVYALTPRGRRAVEQDATGSAGDHPAAQAGEPGRARSAGEHPVQPPAAAVDADRSATPPDGSARGGPWGHGDAAPPG